VFLEIQRLFLEEKLATEEEFNVSRTEEVLAAIRIAARRLTRRLILVVHCLDGPGLATVAAQAEIAALCRMDNLQLVATVESCKFGLLLSA
jgi:hypothetical protein